MSREVIIEFKSVSKIYKLYATSRKRLLSVFFKNIPYREKRATNDVSFKIYKGDSVALLGRNGAGKSTIMKMITGVAYPTTGEVIVNGRVSALLELTSGFDSELTGRENIYLKGQLMGLKDSEIARLEQTIIDFSELGEYIDQPVRTYSSGMKARLGFAVNINIEPEILIIDEALSVGDVAFRRKCLTKVREIMAQEDVTMLFVTHSVSTAKEFCDRGILLKNGQVVLDADIDTAIEAYNNMDKPVKKG
ncbi:MAG: ABC transporter ATP-binding protein [Eubacterium sp.]|nr:ABC transporter ATP-binding protein [Eubacterium sp.]